ncbi:MAG: DUF2254 domain-containing protein [Bacillota bacterium]|nr:DUF2254 domain-containing protein [Bacillota bacterium]
MKAKVQLWYSNHKNIINTTKFLFISIVLLIIVWFTDVNQMDVTVVLPELMLLSVEMSKSLLTTLAGVFLTVATFTFTTILTVMTTYSSSFTPRVVQRFINKPHVLSLIGIFIGGFFYSVLSLFILQDLPTDRRILAGTLGVFYAIAAMIAFMLFVQQVIRDIKGVNLIQDIYDEAKILIEQEADQRKKSQRFEEEKIGKSIRLYANATGYFYDINFEILLDLIKDLSCELVINKKIGEYISKGVYLADLNLTQKDLPEELNEDKAEFLSKIADCFLLNRIKNITRDYHHELTTLVEIALRAISPGINDPNTAIDCIGKISNLLGQLFSTRNKYIVVNTTEQAKIIYTSYTVEEELYLSFYQLIFYGKEDPSVAYAILEGLYLIYMIADDSAKTSVKEFFDYAYEIAFENMQTSFDRKHLQSIRDDFIENRDDQSDTTAVREK